MTNLLSHEVLSWWNHRSPTRGTLQMTNARNIKVIAAVAIVASMLNASEAFASPAAARCLQWAQSQLDPYDLNVMRASVSASARLAVAIRLRSLKAQCRAGLRNHPRHSG